MAKDRYTVTALAPATETQAAMLCADCGALVEDTAAHDKFHELLRGLTRTLPAELRPKGETRRQAQDQT